MKLNLNSSLSRGLSASCAITPTPNNRSISSSSCCKGSRRALACFHSRHVPPLKCSALGVHQMHQSNNDTMQAAATEAAVEQPQQQQHSSPHAAMAHYLAAGRNWRAVEDFYIKLVAGKACLTQIGLAPAGAPAAAVASNEGRAEQVQQQQKVQPASNAIQARTDDTAPLQQSELAGTPRQQPQRKTYKVHMSYLGSSFSGWMRQPGKQTVEGTLAAAIAAAGLADTPAEFRSSKAKRKAAKADRRTKRQAAESQAISASIPETLIDDAAAAAVVGQVPVAQQQQQQQQLVLPLVNCGGRTDAGVTAVGQVISFYSWQPAVQPQQLLACINSALQAAIQAHQAVQPQLAAQPQQAVQPQQAAPPQQAVQPYPGLHHTACNSSAGGSCSSVPALPAACRLRVWRAVEVGREFHATFSASWRRYVYLLPLQQQLQQQQQQSRQVPAADSSPVGHNQQQLLLPRYTDELKAAMQMQHQHGNSRSQAGTSLQQQQQQDHNCGAVQQQQQQRSSCMVLPDADVNPATVNALLQQLQGKKLNYYAYARDTPRGKNCDCTLHVARAHLVHLPPNGDSQSHPQHQRHAPAGADTATQDRTLQQQQQQQHGVPCLCIELLGDRFLRRMVRVLVATAVREAVLADQDHGGASALQGSHAGAAQAGAVQAATAAVIADDSTATAAADGALLAVMSSMDRQATAPPAPALGLCFAAVGYHEDDDHDDDDTHDK